MRCLVKISPGFITTKSAPVSASIGSEVVRLGKITEWSVTSLTPEVEEGFFRVSGRRRISERRRAAALG
jgi:hypothetical protein